MSIAEFIIYDCQGEGGGGGGGDSIKLAGVGIILTYCFWLSFLLGLPFVV